MRKKVKCKYNLTITILNHFFIIQVWHLFIYCCGVECNSKYTKTIICSCWHHYFGFSLILMKILHILSFYQGSLIFYLFLESTWICSVACYRHIPHMTVCIWKKNAIIIICGISLCGDYTFRLFYFLRHCIFSFSFTC